jgi:ubiquinone biosynthesis protein
MNERIGPRALWSNLQREAENWARLLPELPRLAHERLSRPADQAALLAELKALRGEQRRLRRVLGLTLLALAAGIAWLALSGLAWY